MDKSRKIRDKNKKYQKSKLGYQCVGPCYEPGSYFVHPIYLLRVKVKDEAVCPTNLYIKDKENYILDDCSVPTNKKKYDKELETSMLTPFLTFNPENFLKMYYEIFSFEDAIDWVNNNSHSPYFTRKRIINLSFKAYGEGMEIIDNRIIDFLITFFEDNAYKVYIANYMYVGKADGKIQFINKDKNELLFSEDKDKRMNLLIETFINQNELYKFLTWYFKHNVKSWDNIEDHFYSMLNDFNKYISTKIESKLANKSKK